MRYYSVQVNASDATKLLALYRRKLPVIRLFIMAPKSTNARSVENCVERWASHLRGCETKSMLPIAKENCSVTVIDGSQQPDPGPSNSFLCTPEPKRRARAGLEVAEVTGKLIACVDHIDSALQQRLDEAFASSSKQRSHFI